MDVIGKNKIKFINFYKNIKKLDEYNKYCNCIDDI